MRRIKIKGENGKRSGRIYAIKLWFTLLLLKDGIEFERLVRPIKAHNADQLILILEN